MGQNFSPMLLWMRPEGGAVSLQMSTDSSLSSWWKALKHQGFQKDYSLLNKAIQLLNSLVKCHISSSGLNR